MQAICSKVKIWLFLIIIAAFLLLLPAGAYAYSDTLGHWAVKEIELLSAKGIVGGYADGTFRPNRDLTRAEFSKMVISALNMQNDAYSLYNVPSYFTDVSYNHWAKGFIELAYELGIVQGNGDGTFQPERVIRRDEMTAMLYRAMWVSKDLEINPQLKFADAHFIPDWAQGYITKAVEWGLVTGYPDNTFRPAQRTTRAEAAVFTSRLLEARGDLLEFAGVLKEIDFDKEAMAFELFGEDYIFSYKNSIYFYEDDKGRYGLSYLQEKLPIEVCFVVDAGGRVAFLQRSEQNEGRAVDFSSASMNVVNEQLAEESYNIDKKQAAALNYFSKTHIGSEPGKSLEVTKNEMNVQQLVDGTSATGEGQIIAIIDTGVDPGHPDLQITTAGNPKIIDWVDFTDELKVDTSRTITAGNRGITIAGSSYVIENVPSESGVYHYGFISEADIYKDLNFDGDTKDNFLVILSDPDTAGKYDTVYIDIVGTGRVDGAKSYKLFKEQPECFTVSSKDSLRAFNIAVAGIANDAGWVRFGADFNGHGTHVAGVAAANGNIKGVAPGSQLMVLKALNSAGETTWDLLKEAINYAAQNGANIINLSLGYYDDPTAGNNSLTQLISGISSDYDVVFTIATGNNGPGLTTLATPGNTKDALSIGAFVSPAMWKEDYDWNVPVNSLWYFSSVGPRKDGLMVPDVVAPGSVISTAPMWMGRPYSLGEGTSIASPHAAGAVALLWDAMSRLDRYPSSAEIRKAITFSARTLDNYTAAEFGSGVIDVVEAWRKLLMVAEDKPLASQTYNKSLGYGAGLYARDFIPGEISFKIFNNSTDFVDVKWESTAAWLVPQIEQTRISSNGLRTISVAYSIPESPGLYVGFLRGNVVGTYGHDLDALVSVIRPYILDKENLNSMNIRGELGAAQFKRYFFQVPSETERFIMELEIDILHNSPKGRVRGHIIDPNGNEFYMTEYIGLGPPGSTTNNFVSADVVNPKAGVWEVVVYSSASLSELGVSSSNYSLGVSLEGAGNSFPGSVSSRSWMVGGISSERSYKGDIGVTLQVIDKSSKRPINGIIELKGKYYEVKNGKLFMKISE